jgi:adenylate cyclase
VLSLVSAAQGDLASELARADQALALNANCVLAWRIKGVGLICAGRQSTGCETLLTSLRLSPRDPRNRWSWGFLPVAYYLLKDYESTVETATRAIATYSTRTLGYRWLAAALGQLGRAEEARDIMRQAAAVLAPVSFDEYAHRREPWLLVDNHVHMLDGLRKAGWQG